MILRLIALGISLYALGISIYTKEHIIKSNFIETSNLQLELGKKESCITNRDKFIDNQCKIIESLKEDNADIREASYNAEIRATEYARKIKAIEDVMNSKDTLKNKNTKINEILFN